MKKLFTFLLILITFSAFSQDEKRLKIFKFQPFSLITGSMNFNQEIFNKENTRSTVIGLGIRYINRKTDSYDNYGSGNSYEQSNKWQGFTGSIERRFYVPGFFTGEKYSFINKKAKFGVYLAPGMRIEYNINNYDKGGYYQISDPSKPTNLASSFFKNTGKISYFGVMPNMNIGLQFTLFQNLYIDTYIGGGLRVLTKKITEQKIDTTPAGYYYYNNTNVNAIENFVIKEGVQANFGFSLGLNF